MAALLRNAFVRFLLAGTVNTLGTLAIYFLLLEALPPWAAWALAFATGIVFLNIVYPKFVFRVRGTAIAVAGNTSYYLISFLASEALLSAATLLLGIGVHVAGVLVATVMVPVNYLAARFICIGPVRRSASASEKADAP